MPELLEKLRPDHDLQCYFFRPSAIAALSATSATGFTLSGTWRQQFDWAVVEWNRDNVFEHPQFRNLPDGDLSGLQLVYEESRTNCIPMDSDLYPTVDWPTLRIWADGGGGEQIYRVPLKGLSTPIEGSYQPASLQFTLSGTVTPGDSVGLAFLDEHYEYAMREGDILANAVLAITDAINASSGVVTARRSGTTISLTLEDSSSGVQGNRYGAYSYIKGSGTEQWDALVKAFSGGTSPTKWRVTIPFGSLTDPSLGPVPTNKVRKLRWTYAADLQPSTFERTEFVVIVANWQVSGVRRSYQVAGPGSSRIEDDSTELAYSGAWTRSIGNFSGGTIHCSSDLGASVHAKYEAAQSHSLYLGTRMAPNLASVQITIDGLPLPTTHLAIEGEDLLLRHLLGQFGPGQHTVEINHAGPAGSYLYFDFLEIAIVASGPRPNSTESRLTLATDWDTDHSIALAPERTAWIMDSLGFNGRVNHYAGALWFYELVRPGHQYASGTITFASPVDSAITKLLIGRIGTAPVEIDHLNLLGETAAMLAKAFELKINSGYTAVWARADGSILTIYSRSMGVDGNNVTLGVSPSTAGSVSGPTLAGGIDGDWRTDLTAVPRVNRAARDWTRSFCIALKGYGQSDVTIAFSTELQHGDPSVAAGLGQRYPSGNAVFVNTPALQTNFSPVSTDFWKQVYADMAQVQTDAGFVPYLQFGEVQWWYFPNDIDIQGNPVPGMPFYDEYTTATFRNRFGRDVAVIASNKTDPSAVPDEAAFLPTLIGDHTDAIMAFVRTKFPACRFEVLYPPDVNDFPLNRVINYPKASWTPTSLDCLKTESFSYTFARNLDLAAQSMQTEVALGFPPSKRSHLVGLEDSSTAWLKEARMAEASGFESVVLFALDQFCLMGYPLPLSMGLRRSVQFG